VNHAGLRDGRKHSLGILHGIGQRLLAEYDLARFRGRDRDRRVQIARRGDVDDVDVRPRDDGFPVG
jgi:hypothetical protein